MSGTTYQAVVVGGGFFGCSIAHYLKQGGRSVLLVEQEDELFRRASYGNQARIHNGYHYPRSLHTAYRSRINFRRFLADFPDCVVSGFTKLYCIGENLSKVSPRQFERFCDIIGAPWKPARDAYRKLFNPRMIAAVYEVVEHAFDSRILRDTMRRKLDQAGVEVRLGARVAGVTARRGASHVSLSDGGEVQTDLVFNCAYAGLKHVPGLSEHCRTSLKQEITEMALIEPPDSIRELGITVMCGPFFSTMPFPPRGLHTLSHVRYTPHCSWLDTGAGSPDPYQVMETYARKTRAHHMLQDARRYLPALGRARLVDSLFEVKTLLARNEIDDGRPILMERSGGENTVYTIMGGKIDNIYDVLHRLREDGI